jgi:hypothetical protein
VATTAKKRWDRDPSYRPVNLQGYLSRHGPLEDVPDVP